MPEEALESTQAGLQDGCLNEFGNETTTWSFVFPLRDVAKEDVEGIGSKRRANLLEAGFFRSTLPRSPWRVIHSLHELTQGCSRLHKYSSAGGEKSDGIVTCMYVCSFHQSARQQYHL